MSEWIKYTLYGLALVVIITVCFLIEAYLITAA